MSVAVLPPPIGIGFETRKKFTREEFEQMLDSDIFAGARFELIDGDLIDKMGQKPPHASTIRRITKLLSRIVSLERVLIQAPMDVARNDSGTSLPEPDLAILIEDKPDFDNRHPRGDESILAIEVAETSLPRDVGFKRDLYARAGVPEYWVVDIAGRRVIVHRAPARGIYTQVSILSESDSIAFEAHSIAIASILP